MAGPVNLHELANLPGAGKAFQLLDAAGLIGDDPTQPEWRVELQAKMPVTAALTVRAATKDEAMRIVMGRIERLRAAHDLTWEQREDFEDINASYAELIGSREVA